MRYGYFPGLEQQQDGAAAGAVPPQVWGIKSEKGAGVDMVEIVDLVDEVYEAIEWQRLPRRIEEADVRGRLHNIILDSVRYLYI